MREMTLGQIASYCNGKLINCHESTLVTGIVIDSRKVHMGCMFVAIDGERVDGHTFADAAIQAGAVCCIMEKEETGYAGPCMMVESTLSAIKDIAKEYRRLFDIKVIGVTGSVGKTTAKEMIAAVLSAKYSVLKNEGNLNNEIGVPLTLFQLEDHHEVAVVEMGISEFLEMRNLARMVVPDICVFTNIGHCHLESLGDLNGVMKAKGEMFEFANPYGIALVNGDDEVLYKMQPADFFNNAANMKKYYFGLKPHNDFKAGGIRADESLGTACTVYGMERAFEISIPEFGGHAVISCLPAVAAGMLLGLTDDEIKRGILGYKAAMHRGNLVDTGYIKILDDCYNANPMSMRNALNSLAALRGRRICVLGDMRELGRDSALHHKATGNYAASLGLDFIIACGSEAENIYSGAREVCENAVFYDSKKQLLKDLKGLIQEGDNVLVKASRGMQFEEIVQALKEMA